MKLLSYNIRYGGVGREEQLAEVINQAAPDLVLLQEATHPLVVKRLAERTNMRTWAARTGHSLAFLSRLEIAHYEWHRPPGTRRAFLEVQPAGIGGRFFGLHLSAVHANWTERRRARELRATLRRIAEQPEGFHVLAGDFNTLAPGEHLDTRQLPRRLRPLVWLSGGTIRWHTICLMIEAGYIDGYRALFPEERGFTFPTWSPHLRLDYIFLPAAYGERLKACHVLTADPAPGASDHFPVLARFDCDGAAVHPDVRPA